MSTRKKMNAWPGLLLLLLALACVACAKKTTKSSVLDYTQTAERVYQIAQDEFEDENCVPAEMLFERIKRQFPYSRYASLAELRIADCKFIQANFAEAAELFRQFTKAHPTHDEAHYAAYRRGLSFYKMIPGDWIITPPPHERDQSATRDARSALTHFLESYPLSPWRERAMALYQEVEDALVQHEIYVAKFYLRHDDRRAAAARLEGIQNNFTKSKLVPDALFLQAITFLEINEIKDARRVFNEIITQYPDHYQSPRAKDYLKYLEQHGKGENRGQDG